MRIFLAHGASGGVETMRPWIDGLRRRGIDAHAVGLPKGTAERALPAYRAAIGADNPADLTTVVIGGQSFGGRVASMLAAELPFAGLVLLSYPLHRPGHPEQRRTEHWRSIKCPTLLLSGESDPFARVELLRTSTQELANANLVTYPRLGHGLAPVLDDAVARIAEFAAELSIGA